MPVNKLLKVDGERLMEALDDLRYYVTQTVDQAALVTVWADQLSDQNLALHAKIDELEKRINDMNTNGLPVK